MAELARDYDSSRLALWCEGIDMLCRTLTGYDYFDLVEAVIESLRDRVPDDDIARKVRERWPSGVRPRLNINEVRDRLWSDGVEPLSSEERTRVARMIKRFRNKRHNRTRGDVPRI